MTTPTWTRPRLAELYGDGTARSGPLEGPWEQAFFAEIPVEVRSKSNARRYNPKKVADRQRWRAYRSYEELVASFVSDALPEGWELGPPPPAPVAQRPAVVSFIFARSLLDAANLSKSILDGLEGIVYWTDAAVRFSGSLGVRGRHGDSALVAFARLDPGAPPRALLDAGTALGQACAPYLDTEPRNG